MVVTMVERNPAMAAAESAVAWAMRESERAPGATNYERLLADVLRAVRESDPGVPVVLDLPGLSMAHWACLSRMLVMDRPDLAERVHPQYVEALDGQAGVAWLQLQFHRVTGRRPTVRSWRHAPRRGCASL